MNTIEAHYNHIMDLIEQAKEAGLDHIATNEELAPELLELLTTNGFHHENIDRDNEVKGHLVRW